MERLWLACRKWVGGLGGGRWVGGLGGGLTWSWGKARRRG